jgi:hypothetical protein
LLLLLRGCRDGLPMVDTLNMHVLLASKIRQLPHLLPLFFQDSPLDQEGQKAQFSLFDKLLEAIHLDSRAGHLARTACLDILQAVDPDLQDYILNCSIAPRIISVLEGIFTEFSSHELHSMENDSGPFVSMLGFVEQVLETCTKCPRLISETLDEFRLFLHKNFLSSLSKASDFDGSSEQCLRQLLFTLGTISHPLLAELVTYFLLKEDFDTGSDGKFAMQYILLSKIDSCCPTVVVASLQVIASLLRAPFLPFSLPEICPTQDVGLESEKYIHKNHIQDRFSPTEFYQDTHGSQFLDKLIYRLEHFFQNNWKVNLALTACWANLVFALPSALEIQVNGESLVTVKGLLARLREDMESWLDEIPDWQLDMEAYAQNLESIKTSSSSDPKTAVFIKNALIYSECLQELGGVLSAEKVRLHTRSL